VALQWLMFQMGHIGPMFGQVHHFCAPPRSPSPTRSSATEGEDRLYGVLDKRLGEAEYLAGNTRSPISPPTLVARYEWPKTDLNVYPNVKRWFDVIGGDRRSGAGWRCLLDSNLFSRT